MNANMNRRSALRMLAAAGAAACPVCLAKLANANSSGTEHAAPHWSYEGEGAPEHWGNLSPDFKVCDLGLQQSPIDLSGSMRAELSPIPISWSGGEFTVVNNGHTIQVNCKSSGSIGIEGYDFELIQFHIHHPSEHKLDGQLFDLEVHFVHKSAQRGLAVLGVFLRPGAANAALQPVFDAMPAEAGQEVPCAGVDLSALLPATRGYFRYKGSLTTPPCGEVVTWTVFKDPIEVAPEQIAKFATLFPMNARPVQPLNRRFLLESAV
jgi:carbonic anhydrase